MVPYAVCFVLLHPSGVRHRKVDDKCTGLLNNLPTNQLAVSQTADWSSRRQQFFNHEKTTLCAVNLKLNLTLT